MNELLILMEKYQIYYKIILIDVIIITKLKLSTKKTLKIKIDLVQISLLVKSKKNIFHSSSIVIEQKMEHEKCLANKKKIAVKF